MNLTDKPAFQRWFGNSKVVDAEGRPLVVYHGTGESFDVFDLDAARRTRAAEVTGVPGFYFSPSTDVASDYAFGKDGANVMPSYLSLQNPKSVKYSELIGGTFDRASLEADGHDGLAVERGGETWAFVAFNPTQIKSAISNNGEFSDSTGDLHKSRDRVTDTPAFKRWFGDSKVVDANGEPLVVYHGTGADIKEFRVSERGEFGGGIYLTPDATGASDYATYRGQGPANVMPVYVSTKNPASAQEASQVASWRGEDNAQAELIKRGYDGVVDMRSGQIVAFNPTQIKSATGNNGSFDAANPDITK
jgi:hypothetical protein